MADLHEKDELALQPIPNEERTGWLAPLFNMLGCNIALSELMLGATLIATMAFKDFVLASIFGNLILVIILMLQGYIGYKEGLNTYVLSKGAFGEIGGKWLISILLAITSFGWFGVQTGVAGASIQALAPEANLTLMIIISGVVMTLLAAFGFKVMALMNYAAIPLLIILIVWGTIRAFGVLNGVSMIDFVPEGGSTTSLLNAMNQVVGLVIVGAIISPDQLRYTKGVKDVFIIGFVGIAGISVMQQVAAGVMAVSSGTSDITLIFGILGFGWYALVIVILAAVSTNISNAYSGGLALKTVLPNVTRTTLTLIAGAFGTILAATGITSNFSSFLSILSGLVPSIAGVMWCEYYVIQKKKFIVRDGVNISAVLAWIIGCATSFLTSSNGFGFPPINGIIVSAVIYFALTKVIKNQNKEQ